MKRGGPLHPKTFELAEALGIRRAHAIGTLELLFHFSSQYAPEGDVGRYSDKRIAAALDWAGSPSKLVIALVETRWLEPHPTARLVVHDWGEHADRTTLQRLHRSGKTPIQTAQQVTAKVCTQSEVGCEQKSALPLPLPLPEPEPEPEPFISVGRESSSERKGRPPDEDLESIKTLLQEFCEIRKLDFGPPDEDICLKVHEALNGHSIPQFQQFLSGLIKRHKQPVQSYAWFVTVAGQHFRQGNSNGAIRKPMDVMGRELPPLALVRS